MSPTKWIGRLIMWASGKLSGRKTHTAVATSAPATQNPTHTVPANMSLAEKSEALAGWYANQDSAAFHTSRLYQILRIDTTFMWHLVLGLAVFSAISIYQGWIVPLSASLILIGWILSEGLKKPIPNDPPNVGVETLWGSATGRVLNEGYQLLANYWPFKLDVILIDVSKYGFSITQNDVTCITETTLDDGSVAQIPDTSLIIKMTVQMGPDASFSSLMQYIKSGKRDGVEKVVIDIVSRIVRDFGTRVTADKYMTLKLPLSAYIASRLTNMPVSYLIDKSKPDTPANRNIIIDVFDEGVTKEEIRTHKERLASWLRELEDRGAGDVHGLGVQIYKFNVDSIDYQNPEVRKAVDQRRIEMGQRESERLNAETKALAAKKLAGIPKDALEALLIMNGHGKLDKKVNEDRKIITFTGPDGKIIDPSIGQAIMATDAGKDSN